MYKFLFFLFSFSIVFSQTDFLLKEMTFDEQTKMEDYLLNLSIGSDVIMGSSNTAQIMINKPNQVIAGEHVRITYMQKNKLYLLNISKYKMK